MHLLLQDRGKMRQFIVGKRIAVEALSVACSVRIRSVAYIRLLLQHQCERGECMSLLITKGMVVEA